MKDALWLILGVGVLYLLLNRSGGNEPSVMVVPGGSQAPSGDSAKQPFGAAPAKQNSWIEDFKAGVSVAKDVSSFLSSTGIFGK